MVGYDGIESLRVGYACGMVARGVVGCGVAWRGAWGVMRGRVELACGGARECFC